MKNLFPNSGYILISVIISWFIANSIDATHKELGALVNYYFPWIIGVLTLVVYLIGIYFVKEEKSLRILAAAMILANLIGGKYIRFAEF